MLSTKTLDITAPGSILLRRETHVLLDGAGAAGEGVSEYGGEFTTGAPHRPLCRSPFVVLFISPVRRLEVLHAGGRGRGRPELENLNDELTLQGHKNVPIGYSIGISLGRSFGENQWSLEAHFCAALLTSSTIRAPTTASPRGCGITATWRSCGGTSGRKERSSSPRSAQASATASRRSSPGAESSARPKRSSRGESTRRYETTSISPSNARTTGGFKEGVRSRPFLENVDTDVVLDSSGNPLKEMYRSLDIRLGFTFWLKQKVME